jgi:hypothetical protein
MGLRVTTGLLAGGCVGQVGVEDLADEGGAAATLAEGEERQALGDRVGTRTTI